jgi:coiled-coil and C2 domain-containing protein 2A
MPFTDVDAVVEAVYNTHIHDVADQRVEFALAVYVHPYPNDIYSLWTYVVALTRRR